MKQRYRHLRRRPAIARINYRYCSKKWFEGMVVFSDDVNFDNIKEHEFSTPVHTFEYARRFTPNEVMPTTPDYRIPHIITQ